MVLTPLVKTLDGRKGRRCSTFPVGLPTFSRSSAFDCGTAILPESKICRTISERKLRKSTSASAVCCGMSWEIIGVVALWAAALLCGVLWLLFLDRLGAGLVVESGLVRFLELVLCSFFGFPITPQQGRRGIVPHRTNIFSAILSAHRGCRCWAMGPARWASPGRSFQHACSPRESTRCSAKSAQPTNEYMTYKHEQTITRTVNGAIIDGVGLPLGERSCGRPQALGSKSRTSWASERIYSARMNLPATVALLSLNGAAGAEPW